MDDPVLQLGHAIAGRGRCLVILDNFEQVAPPRRRHAGPLAGPRRRGAVPGHHSRGARPAGRGGAGAARRWTRLIGGRCSSRARPRRNTTSSRDAADRDSDRSAGRAARRLAAGHRAGGGPGARDVARRRCWLAWAQRFKLLTAIGGRQRSAGHAACHVRLVVGAADRCREGGLGAAVGVRGKLWS